MPFSMFFTELKLF